jgi:glycosyltransferase involved in cell wall biosynthesis
MRIGIDAHAIGSESAGNETYYEQLLKHLAAVPANDNRYVVYYTHPDAAARLPTREKFYLKRLWPGTPFWRILVGLPLESRRERLDVFHAQYVIPPFRACKTVVTIHDIAYEHYPEFFSKLDVLYGKILIRGSADRADHIITVSNYSKNDLSNTYHIDPDRITVTYEGAGLDFYPRDKEECKEHLDRDYGIKGPFLLYVGRLQERKNLRRLLSAYATIKKHGAEEKIVLVGKQDWMSGNIQEHVKSLDLEDSVIFAGYVSTADLPIFLNAAEAFVYPSIFEGFGLPVIEAMACGTAVLTSYGSSLQEVAGDAALLVDPMSEASIAQGLNNLLDDSTLRMKLGQAGLVRSALFNFAKTAEQTIGVYEMLAGTASRS